MCESWSRARRSCATRKPVFPCQSSHQTSCNRILEHFLMTNDPRERLSVLKFPFRAVTPKTGRTGLSASRCASSGAFISSTMMVMMAITPSLNTSSRPGDTKILLTINDTFLCQWIDPGLRTFGLWIAKARKKRGSEVSTPILLGPSGAAVSRQGDQTNCFVQAQSPRYAPAFFTPAIWELHGWRYHS